MSESKRILNVEKSPIYQMTKLKTTKKKEGTDNLPAPSKVGMTRLELATSRPPDVCATNCATSRSLICDLSQSRCKGITKN